MSRRSSAKSLIRRAARAVLGVVAVLVVVSGVARAGTRLFYCPLMDAVMATPCCGTHGAHHDASDPAAFVTQTDCCRPLALPALPEGTTSPPDDGIAPAAPSAPFATTTLLALAAPPPAPRARALAHGLPPPLSSSARCSLLRAYRL